MDYFDYFYLRDFILDNNSLLCLFLCFPFSVSISQLFASFWSELYGFDVCMWLRTRDYNLLQKSFVNP